MVEQEQEEAKADGEFRSISNGQMGTDPNRIEPEAVQANEENDDDGYDP